MVLADNLKRQKKKRRWSQTQLVEQIGSHLSRINRIETGKYNPSLDVVQKLASTFDVSIDYLVPDRKGIFRPHAAFSQFSNPRRSHTTPPVGKQLRPCLEPESYTFRSSTI